MNTYEGMFLFDPAVTTDWEQVKTELDRLMERAGATMVASGKWDERRLAFEINGRKRAIYVLAYFQAPADKIVSMERDVQLSEAVLRCLILRADHVSEEEMKNALSSTGRRYSGDDGEDDGDYRSRRGRPAAASAPATPAAPAPVASAAVPSPSEPESVVSAEADQAEE